MGSPISETLAEIYLQLLEGRYIKHWIEDQNIVYYKRYVDGIFVIFDTSRINEITINELTINIENLPAKMPQFNTPPTTHRIINMQHIDTT